MRLPQGLQTLLSLLLYAGIYYLIFHDLRSIALLLAVIILHEGGHYVAMSILGYTDVRMLFIPLFGAFVSGKPATFDPGKKIMVLFSGPLPGILLGMICAYLYTVNHHHILYQLALMFMFLNAFNLLPLTPMDGGQLLELIFPAHSRWVQLLFILLGTGALALGVYLTQNPIWLLPVLLLGYRFVVIWRRKPAAAAHEDAGAVASPGVFQTFVCILVWLVFMVLPMITLYRMF